VPTVYHKLLAAIAASSEEERQRVKRGLQEHVRLMVCGSAALVFFFFGIRQEHVRRGLMVCGSAALVSIYFCLLQEHVRLLV
jgi:hypothetical protein